MAIGNTMSDAHQLQTFLTRFFHTQFYSTAIEKARARIASDAAQLDQWTRIKILIESRAMPAGAPLKLVHHYANQMIDDNTDDEAYAWLDLMVRNIDRTDGLIDEY